jgi:pimeloyl-ACP methyl ester carboxylesterase
VPWWESLDPDFARRPEPFDLGFRDKLQVGASAAFDVGLRTAGACLVSGLSIPLGYHPLELRRAIQDMEFYEPMARSGDATRFFKPPPKNIRVRTSEANWYPRFSPEDGSTEVVQFDSPFMPVNPRLHSSYLKHKANRVAYARYWRHHDGPRPTIIAVHGFTADFYLINEWFFALPWFYRMGCDVMLFTLPFHGPRQTEYSPFSGHGYFAGGSSQLNEAAAQSVMDLRVIIDWLMEKRGAPKVGVTGLSLGGFTSALLAAAEPRLSFAIPNVPVVSLADLVLEWEPIGLTIRTALKLVGRPITDARKFVSVSSPLSYQPAIPREKLMIVGGVGDRLAPPKHSRLLWDHWERCRIHWFPGSHIIHLDRGAYLREIARFLHKTQFLPESA